MRRIDFLWIIILVGLCWNLALAQREIEFSKNFEWVSVEHESGTQYILRTKGIIGFVFPMPGDPKKRSGILMSNGSHLSTTMDIAEFEKLLELEHGEMKAIEVKGGP